MLQGNEKEIIHGGQDFNIGKIIFEGVEIIPLKQWVSLQRAYNYNKHYLQFVILWFFHLIL
jgi:hypothetical protein